MVGEYKIVFKRAGCYFRNRCCCHVNVSAFSSGRAFPLLRKITPRNGDVESLPAAPVDPLPAAADPTYGDVEAAVDASFTNQIDAIAARIVTKTRTASPRRGTIPTPWQPGTCCYFHAIVKILQALRPIATTPRCAPSSSKPAQTPVRQCDGAPLFDPRPW